jgi:LysR family glycine cleavage system transcriptional activator
MYQRLPPLNALRAFEAAVRHESFSRAADELFVTHGAVSRAIRQLEEDLGQPLFRRTTRSVTPTAAGEAYAVEVRAVLDRLMRATLQARAHSTAGALTVSTLDSFAGKWLLPRLQDFRHRQPDIDVRLSTSEALADFIHDDIDIAIRYGNGNYAGLKSDFLLGEEMFPVCSPKLLEGPHPLKCPDDLVHHPLIHDVFHIDWKMWLRAAGIDFEEPLRGPTYPTSHYGIQAAIQGDGVALGRSALVADDLAAGRLVQPFVLALAADHAYYVVYPPQALENPKICAFRDWLLAQVGAEAEPGCG